MSKCMEKAKEVFMSGETVKKCEFLSGMYDLYDVQETLYGAHIRQQMETLDESLKGLPFSRRDAIGCACFHLCSEYEYAAFTTGFQKGAALILRLLQET